MKLYTEEQVKEMLNKINSVLPKRASLLSYMVENITEYMTPIELPSDDEIEESETDSPYDRIDEYNYGFIDGANWVKKFILNQNK